MYIFFHVRQNSSHCCVMCDRFTVSSVYHSETNHSFWPVDKDFRGNWAARSRRANRPVTEPNTRSWRGRESRGRRLSHANTTPTQPDLTLLLFPPLWLRPRSRKKDIRMWSRSFTLAYWSQVFRTVISVRARTAPVTCYAHVHVWNIFLKRSAADGSCAGNVESVKSRDLLRKSRRGRKTRLTSCSWLYTICAVLETFCDSSQMNINYSFSHLRSALQSSRCFYSCVRWTSWKYDRKRSDGVCIRTFI